MKLTEVLLSLTFYEATSSIEGIEVNNIEIDSRNVKPGSLFVCIDGFTVDGHDYVQQAVDNGAIAIIAEKKVTSSVPTIFVPNSSRTLAMLAVTFYNNPTRTIPLIGVTGTNGKTTVTYLLDTIFNKHHKKTGVIGTIQMKIGEEIYPIENTTPDALLLQQSFKKMLDQHVDQAIMEVSSHALDIGRVYGCDFDIAIFTNLSQDHLDYHNSIDDYLRAKILLFAQLGNTYHEGTQKYAIINEDDPSSKLIKQSTAQHVLTYGYKNDADVMATHVKLHAEGTSFLLWTPIGTIDINSRLIGMFNVYNMLAASAAAIASNVPLDIIKYALESIKGVNGRFEPVATEQPYAVIVDYAHTPDSLENVLATMKDFAKKNIYVVIGCGGDRDRTKRPLMATVALQYADHAIFTSDNPRSEDPQSILDDMITGIDYDRRKYEVIEDRKEAIYKAIEHAQADDIVLIAGKGHETYQQIGHVKYDFDDRRIAEEAIRTKEK
ncbi:UDP-N-acetylmuramoyl-L-alanyl-D-glutamate--2,6-diaminopimelate ligase [Virgibacillus natechei]|uniref:UDP-N-acetylmuramoyl-L-alanyl-D-glutamate--2,6-diaminopimelate ligase n=1 Tax=Virgibacillus natechei TaxID=1216297 RepID=A0ABS4IB93_9BACI|nr:UDP-N-acetylmuramoyl-L-alanyl-D-glutamate--2,6-diaminopimelate ligase [Virgibacillus natechei]MBP1968197.1 UDP-N-acetylmuramoyl-L-alanyl-D-glutamate--2,6-diaminopimelate ligase [Virgibacillus natechei]UZD14531.1 UDP-N-acetylmuramoyl-L-alanyl-D-glutamate--2,6-diaminopimelate ligase [Virgibacillus natechei]